MLFLISLQIQFVLLKCSWVCVWGSQRSKVDLNSHLFPHGFAKLSGLNREVSLCSAWWPAQKLTTGQRAENTWLQNARLHTGMLPAGLGTIRRGGILPSSSCGQPRIMATVCILLAVWETSLNNNLKGGIPHPALAFLFGHLWLPYEIYLLFICFSSIWDVVGTWMGTALHRICKEARVANKHSPESCVNIFYLCFPHPLSLDPPAGEPRLWRLSSLLGLQGSPSVQQWPTQHIAGSSGPSTSSPQAQGSQTSDLLSIISLLAAKGGVLFLCTLHGLLCASSGLHFQARRGPAFSARLHGLSPTLEL